MRTPLSNERYGLEFGSGSFVGMVMQPETDFFDISIADQALRLGWADGCPIPVQLIDSSEPGRGPEAMRQRYAEVNFWFQEILRETAELNPDLYERLAMTIPRHRNDPPGKYELQSVPVTYEKSMAPMDTLWGYALPRVLIEQFKGNGKDAPDNKQAAQDRLIRGIGILEDAIRTSSKPLELLAKLSEGVAQADALPIAVLHHALSKGKFEEENQPGMWMSAQNHLYLAAPKLWELYSSLTLDQMNKADIVKLSDIWRPGALVLDDSLF